MAYQYAPIAAEQGANGLAQLPDVPESVYAKCCAVVAHLKSVLKARGCHGILSLGQKFRSMDDDGSKTLNYAEFSKAMREMNLDESALNAMFRYFDADCNGVITYDEFLVGLRGDMNARRQAVVDEAYSALDANGDGQVDLQDVFGRYDVSQHPDLQSGIKTKTEILKEFLATFECGEADGIVSNEEFNRYYQALSASIDEDDYFELMVRNAWHLSGGEGWAENTSNRRVLVTHANGHQSIEEITDMDVGRGDIEGMKAALRARGINAMSLELLGDASEQTPAAMAPTTDEQIVKNKREATNIRAKNMQSSIIF
eukprot:evm.model.scf_1474EXC.1 EVM.evm.TU.scf_1474EXC.1   scf_1474EXC:12822-13763(+)